MKDRLVIDLPRGLFARVGNVAYDLRLDPETLAWEIRRRDGRPVTDAEAGAVIRRAEELAR
jgi:hypothetical protein